MLNFGQKVEEKSGDIIPKDALLWAVINIRKINNSRETNGRYLDIELTIADGIPFARRKIWTMIADPFDTNNSEEWRTMGYGAIRRVLEAVKGARPDDANSYSLNRLEDLHGLMVPILVTIEKGKDGYDDKNKCEFLSPYSSVKKIAEGYRLLQTGVYTIAKESKAPAPGQGSMFAGTASAPPAALNTAPPAAGATPPPAANSAPGWLAPAAGTPAQPPAGQAPFVPGAAPTPQQAPQQPTGFAPPTGQPSSAAPAPTASGTSPSNGWVAPGAGAPAQFPGQ